MKTAIEFLESIDIEKLAEEFAKNHSIYPTAQDDTEYGFKHGFQKAIELIKQQELGEKNGDGNTQDNN